VSAAVHAATLSASEPDCHRLTAALEEDDVLGGLTIDTAEETPDLWRVTLYLPEAPDATLRARLAAAARAALGPEGPGFAITRLPDINWVAKSLEGLKPVRAGRFLVHGGHDRDKAQPNDIAIEIEAGEAFGTGHHGTTAGCLLAIERTVKTRTVRNALDVGTGSGVLAIAIARLARCPVLASDIDPVATRVAAENVRLNGVAPLVRLATAAGIGLRLFAREGPYDLVVANILAGPLVALAPAIRRAVAPGGTVILSGLTVSQIGRVSAAYRRLGLRPTVPGIIDDWATLTFVRP